MKKSNKKMKSDRINALRKQYDAFLEEDKKRKERNEFILDKIDKVRYFSVTVPRRSAPLHVSPQMGLYTRIGKPMENSSIYDRYLSSPNEQLPLEVTKKIDDSILLKEVIKKYILIPKLNSTPIKEYTETLNPVMDVDSDWKSKYDILNKLKLNEKIAEVNENERLIKEISDAHVKKSDESFQNSTHREDIINNYESDIPNTKQETLKNEKPEKDVSDTKSENEIKQIGHNKQIREQHVDSAFFMSDEKQYNVDKILHISPETMYNVESKLNTVSLDQAVSGSTNFINNPVEQQNDYTINGTTSNTVECSGVYSNDTLLNKDELQQKEYLDIYDHNHTQQPITSAIQSEIVPSHHNTNSIHQKEPEILAEESINVSNVVTTEEPYDATTEYPIDIINVQEFTPYEDAELQDGVNVNPHTKQEDSSPQYESHNEPEVEKTENDPGDVSGIEAFDEEQREMFYSEQTNENYTYDQTNPENTYQEHPQNENYQQNEEYAYYEGVQPDQTYPVEVNEFDETSEPYDQTYQEQYGAYDQEGYVQQEHYEQQPQYEEIQEIDPNLQPEIEQLQYEHINYDPQHIEQQLDNEQGYTENQDLDNSQNELLENVPNQDVKNITNEALDNSEITGNIIQKDTLNN